MAVRHRPGAVVKSSAFCYEKATLVRIADLRYDLAG
jgi:hypothetical protein